MIDKYVSRLTYTGDGVENHQILNHVNDKAGDLGSIPGLGRSPGERNGNSPQYSCLENSMDGGSW